MTGLSGRPLGGPGRLRAQGARALVPTPWRRGRWAEVPIRPAATLMVVRDAGDAAEGGLEVLMLRRNPRSTFVGGAFVFPGGAVDRADGEQAQAALCVGRSDEETSAILGLSRGGLAYWVAAVRECFEEAGVLLASRADGAPVALADPAVRARFARHRVELNAGRLGFVDFCRSEDLRLRLDLVHYFSHWITPKGPPRRFDTRFFVAAAPPDQNPTPDTTETVDYAWVRPAEALGRHRVRDMGLILPTIRTLGAIRRFETSGQLLDAAVAAAGLPGGEARFVTDGRGRRIPLPGDPGYPVADPAAPAPAPGQ